MLHHIVYDIYYETNTSKFKAYHDCMASQIGKKRRGLSFRGLTGPWSRG